MTTVAVVLFDKPRRDGKWPVRIRVTTNRKITYETICYAFPHHFNRQTLISAEDPNFATLNEKILCRLDQVRRITENLNSGDWTLTGKSVLRTDYAEWQKQEVDTVPAAGGMPTSFLDHAVSAR